MSCAVEQFRRGYDREAWKNFLVAERCLMESRFKPKSPELEEHINMFGKPYYMREESYQVLRAREPQRRLADPGDKNYKAGGGDLVRPCPRIRSERRPPSPACVNRLTKVGSRHNKVSVRPFKNHFWLGDIVVSEIKEESSDVKQKTVEKHFSCK